MRLIDADALWDKQMETMATLVKSVAQQNLSSEALSLLCGTYLISEAHTVDAVPVVHGRWELVDEAEPRRYGCSRCSCLSWYGTYNYCPNCGALMGGRSNGGK